MPLPLALRLPLILIAILSSTLLHVTVLMLAVIPKALAPASRRAHIAQAMARIAESWIGVNNWLIRVFTRTRWQVELAAHLDHSRNYLVLCNHQSWVDIPVLQYLFNRRIPLLRFFLKHELIWVPLLGPAWWALDFPFMRRYSREQLARRPELAGTDIDATRRACEKFREIPVAVMNFVEGTRFEPGKQARQESPYARLLRPRAGGVAFVLDAMGRGLHSILDVTVAYPNGRPTVLDLLCDRIGEVRVHVLERPIPRSAPDSDYEGNPAYRVAFQAWINGVWEEKDARLALLLAAPEAATPD